MLFIGMNMSVLVSYAICYWPIYGGLSNVKYYDATTLLIANTTETREYEDSLINP